MRKRRDLPAWRVSRRAAALAALAATALAGSAAAVEEPDLQSVFVTAIVRDTTVDAIFEGIRDALRDAGLREGETLRLQFEDAGADSGKAAELARGFGRAGLDVVVALTEPSARLTAGESLRVPIVIAGVKAEVARDIRRNRNARTLTGIVEGDSHDAAFDLIREIAPEVRTVAVPVDADDEPPDTVMRGLIGAARDLDLTVAPLPVSVERNAIAATIGEFAPQETAIYLDSRMLPDAPVEAIVTAAETAGLLVFANTEDAVVRGALAAVVADAYGTGTQVGALVARILDQPSAARAPMRLARPSYLVLNRDTAARVGVELSDDLLERRGRVFGWADTGGPRPRAKPPPPERPPTLSNEPKTGVANPHSKPPDPDP